MKFRSIFEAKERSKESNQIETYIRGGSMDQSPLLSESLGDDPVGELESKVNAAKEEMDAHPGNAFLRQKWLYYASLHRDFQYGRASRRRMKALGLNGLFMENYNGAKIAADSANKK